MAEFTRPSGMSQPVSYVDAATRAGLLARYGGTWLTHLDAIVERELRRLDVEVDQLLAGGRTACVLVVSGRSGRGVLKLTPDLARSHRETSALARLSAAGVSPPVREAWTSKYDEAEYHGMLIALVGNGSSLRDAPDRCPPASELAGLLESIAACGTIPLEVELEDVTSHVRRGLDRGSGGGLRGTPPPTADELNWGYEALARLERARPTTWVHGTLHPANLVLGPRERLHAIDPRPFLGPPEYDVAELALKIGSERAGRNHNLFDGLQLLEELSSTSTFDADLAELWLRTIAMSGV